MARRFAAAWWGGILAWGLAAPSGLRAEDCRAINPKTLTLAQSDAWKIADGKTTLWDFGQREDLARRAMSAIQFYSPDTYCALSPSFHYMLSGGSAPTGSMPDEHCVPVRQAELKVASASGRWKITQGNQEWLFDFSDESSARSGLDVVKRYSIAYSCFAPPFTYLRR